ncbi:uncharacterized protein B0I36DRAFT_368077 [Microdochium trichocladiopsis]|uniref:Zn(2)-C6 fungal-type domain-containing protein n=1 Tax=Microdochium trichocladiopsis TaxID=1682393 RepID=A0A9P8XUA4_9PEZI|nr:uncharacterized protein B0I36DRAFT_368077 [Microdochium trichocladiopsis]KAH7018025.1 hypothetical protein B0I36DRAFT_368077 [Microdochium trichocladiopsis]
MASPTVIQFRVDQGQPPPAAGLSGRAYHSKSRAGCFPCKKRHVRCDEAKPACSSCRRLLLQCEYPTPRPARKAAPVKQQAMQGVLRLAKHGKEETTPPCHEPLRAKQPPAAFRTTARSQARMTRHLWTVEDTARAIVHAAFQNFDPARLTRGDMLALMLPRESLHKEYYRYVCLAIRDLSMSPNKELRAKGLRTMCQSEHLGSANSGRGTKENDRHLVSAVRNYAHALATFRDALPSMSPPDIAYATVCFGGLELLQGNIASRNVILVAGAAMLRAHVVAPREVRSDGALRYGVHPRYADWRCLCDAEALIVRFASAGVLAGHTVPVVAASSSNGGKKKSLLPTFHLPGTLPAPPELRGGGFTGPLDLEALRCRWNAFHGTFESWLLSRYWAIAAGQTLDARQHLADEARLWKHMGVWQRRLRHIIRAIQKEEGKGQRKTCETNLATMRMLSAYLHCYQIAMAATVWDGPGASAASSGAAAGPGRPESAGEVPVDVDAASLADLTRLETRTVDGFGANCCGDLFLDCAILPLIARQATRKVWGRAATASAGNMDGTASFTATATATATTTTEERQRLLAERQLALLDLQTQVVKRAIDEQAEQVAKAYAGQQHPAWTTAARRDAEAGCVAASSSSSSGTPDASRWRPAPDRNSNVPPREEKHEDSTSSTSRSEDCGDGVVPPLFAAAERGPRSWPISSSPTSPGLQKQSSQKQETRPSPPEPIHHQHQPRTTPSSHHGPFQVVIFITRRETILACMPIHVATARAGLRDGVFYTQVVA